MVIGGACASGAGPPPTLLALSGERGYAPGVYLPGHALAAVRLVPATAAAGSTPATDRRARIVREMVGTVQQYVRTYGAAPDFASNQQATICRVHNYIRSVTTRQKAPADILEDVRGELARNQAE